MVPGPTRWQNIHGSQTNFEPDSSVTFSAPLLPLIMSDGLGRTTAAQSSTIPDGLTPILRFLHSFPVCHSGADLQAAVVPLQIADLHSFGARGDKLVSWYLPRGSVGSAQVGALRSEKEALTVVLRTWEDLFAECTRSMCVCVCLLLYGMGIAACARQLEWKQHCPKPTTHESGGLSSTHENIFHPPCFIFNQTFVALTVRFQSDLSSLVPCGSNVQLDSGKKAKHRQFISLWPLKIRVTPLCNEYVWSDYERMRGFNYNRWISRN